MDGAGGTEREDLLAASQSHVIFEPLDFIARLAALVPQPRVNLTRYHGVFAPHSQHRALVTSAGRGMGKGVRQTRSADERHTAMTWALRLKRVFNIDIETCERCGGRVRIIASIEDPAVIRRILEHLEAQADTSTATPILQSRVPPRAYPLD